MEKTPLLDVNSITPTLLEPSGRSKVYGKNTDQLKTMLFISEYIVAEMKNINDPQEFIDNPCFPMYQKAAGTPLHEMASYLVYATKGPLDARSLLLIFEFHFRQILGTTRYWNTHYQALYPLAEEVAKIWNEDFND